MEQLLYGWYNVISFKGVVRLNVGRTHDIMDTSVYLRIIDIPELYSRGSELKPRPRRQA